MKKDCIAFIIIILLFVSRSINLSADAANSNIDTLVPKAYLEKIEQANQLMNDTLVQLRMEQRLSEFVEKKADRNMNMNIGFFGTLIALVSIVVPLIINKDQRKKMDETSMKLDETARKSEKAVVDIAQLENKILEYSKQVQQSVKEAEKSAKEAKSLTYFMEAIREEDPDWQIDLYTKSINEDDNNVNAYRNRGVAYAEKGEPNKAIADYTKAIEINPMDAESYYCRSLTYMLQAQEKDEERKSEFALALYKSAIDDFGIFLQIWTKDDNLRFNAVTHKKGCEEAVQKLTKSE